MLWYLAHICIGIWTRHGKVFNLDLDWWRHLGAILWNFLKIISWSYLHNQKVFIIHIYHDQGQYQSGQLQVKKRARARTSARQCARKKIKCSKSSQIYFAYVSGHFKHFIKNRAYEHARAFSRVTPLHNIESPFSFLSWYFSYVFKEFDTMFISLWPLITRWASIQDKCPCARALLIHSIYGQIHYSSLEWTVTFNVFSFLNRVWVGNMIPCLIWPLSVSWHHHNGLGTQNTNLHIMTSAYLCKIYCISVNIDQFSSKFRYVVAKTILYKRSNNHFSFWWRHHSENFG